MEVEEQSNHYYQGPNYYQGPSTVFQRVFLRGVPLLCGDELRRLPRRDGSVGPNSLQGLQGQSKCLVVE